MPTKYNSTKVRTAEGSFDSMGEYRHWVKLNLLRQATDRERVVHIDRQVNYRLEVDGHLITTYRADFVVTYADGRTEVQDFKNPYLLGKGKSTPAGQLFTIKRKLMAACHGLDIITVTCLLLLLSLASCTPKAYPIF